MSGSGYSGQVLILESQTQSTLNMASQAPGQAMSGVNISKRRKFVADGVFYAELNEFFQRELAEEGYSGVEVRVTPTVSASADQAFVQSNVGLAGHRYHHPCHTHTGSFGRAGSSNP